MIAVLLGFVAILLMILVVGASSWVQVEGFREGLWDKCVFIAEDRITCQPGEERCKYITHVGKRRRGILYRLRCNVMTTLMRSCINVMNPMERRLRLETKWLISCGHLHRPIRTFTSRIKKSENLSLNRQQPHWWECEYVHAGLIIHLTKRCWISFLYDKLYL